MKSFVKKISLSAVCAMFLSVGANAACNNGNYCDVIGVGVGGLHSQINETDANIKEYGGYVNLYWHMFYKRLYFAGNVRMGGGQINFSGASLTTLRGSPFFYLGGPLEMGVNIFTRNAPLILGIFYQYETIWSKNFDRGLMGLGVKLSGEIPIGKARILYSGGYGWVTPLSNYEVDGKVGWFDGYNYSINASLGFSYNVTEKIAMNIRAIGEYYNLNSLSVNNVNFPSLNQYVGMLEVGFTRVVKNR